MATSPTSPNAFLAIFWGGLACGILDITQAMIAYHLQSGAKPIQILQSVASGVLGRESFRGGMKSAALGAVLHFLIAFTAAAVFYVASRKIHFLITHAIIARMLSCYMVWPLMTFVSIPLSTIGH